MNSCKLAYYIMPFVSINMYSWEWTSHQHANLVIRWRTIDVINFDGNYIFTLNLTPGFNG